MTVLATIALSMLRDVETHPYGSAACD